MKTENHLNIIYQNVRGINTKLANLYIESFNINHHIVILTETWLNKNTLSTEILCNDFNIFRRDRETLTTGGGVLIAVLNIFQSDELKFEYYSDIEFICVRIKLNSSHIFLTCSYIPPKSDQLTYMKHFESIKSVVSNAQPEDFVYVFGDFNLSAVIWKFLPDSYSYAPIKSDAFIEEFLNNLSDLCLFQKNGICNEYGNNLDLVFVNEPTNCTIARTLPITRPEDRYHPTLEVSHNMLSDAFCNQDDTNDKRLCFEKTNYDDLNYCLTNTNWLELLSIPNGTPASIDYMINTFYTTMHNLFEECVPKLFVIKHSGPPWNSPHLSRLKNVKNKCYKKYKQYRTVYDYGKYCVSRAEYNLLNRRLYINYLEKMKRNFKRDPKSFYNFVNSKRKSTGYPRVMKYLSNESHINMIKSNMFADFFSTTYSKQQYDTSTEYPFSLMEHQAISFSSIDTSQVVLSLKTIKSSLRSGPDGIPACVLKNCAHALATPLAIMFNVSLKYGYFPQFWRKSYIIPIFKSGNKSDITNYRGIAKLSAIPKLFEKCLTDSLFHSVSSMISPYQHGFRKGCSAVTNILQLTTLTNRAFKDGQLMDVIYTDFSKAFDKINHNLLLTKLNLLGFTSNALSWLRSYLTCRTQCVILDNTISNEICASSGVPQGSHLGPLLFSLFINDLPLVMKHCNILMYADDVKMFLSYKLSSDGAYLQQDLNSFYAWCKYNQMELNLKKCKHMRFSRNCTSMIHYFLDGYQLELVGEFLDLGILLDPKLDFCKHITMTINKARGVLAYIKRWSKEFTDANVTKQLYTSLVRPILEYGSIVWDPEINMHIDRIESVQKQFLLFCLRSSFGRYSGNLPSYTARLSLIKLPTLKSRRTMLNVAFLINLINGDVLSDFLLRNINFNIPRRFTRHLIPLYLPVVQTNYADADPLRRICKNFNELYSLIDFSINVKVIKRNIILFLNT